MIFKESNTCVHFWDRFTRGSHRFPQARLSPFRKGLLVIAKFLESQLGGSLVEEVPALGLETAHRHVILSGDAKAEGDDVMLGGWRPARDGSTTGAPWFRLRLTRRNAPWAFGAGEPFRRIASLELFTTLLCFMLLVTSDDLDSDLLLRLTSETDNLGNSHAVSKLMTTRFPLVAFLAELAVQVHSKRASLDVAWVPRMQNLESDELSNNLTRRFDPQTEVPVDLAQLELQILPALLDYGAPLYEDIAKAKLLRKASVDISLQNGKGRKRPLEDRLRHTDPW